MHAITIKLHSSYNPTLIYPDDMYVKHKPYTTNHYTNKLHHSRSVTIDSHTIFGYFWVWGYF